MNGSSHSQSCAGTVVDVHFPYVHSSCLLLLLLLLLRLPYDRRRGGGGGGGGSSSGSRVGETRSRIAR